MCPFFNRETQLMDSNRLRILCLAALAALALYPLASYPCEPEPLEVTEIVSATELAQLAELDEWLVRLEDGWIPLFIFSDEDF